MEIKKTRVIPSEEEALAARDALTASLKDGSFWLEVRERAKPKLEVEERRLRYDANGHIRR